MIEQRSPVTVGVVGLAGAGLPVAVSLASAGLLTTGLDSDRAKVAALRNGEPCLAGVSADELVAVADWFEATTDPELLTGLDVYVVCAEAGVDVVAPLVTRGAVVVLPAGVNVDFVHRLAEGSGLRPGADFHVTIAHDLTSAARNAIELRDASSTIRAA